jgi:pimeloyl-ACP methyl ester carboxylesterase
MTTRTFVLVHGAWHDGQAWRRVRPLLEARGHRVHTPSLTGHGDQAHLLGPDVGLSTHVDDVVALVLAEDLTDVVLVGHSYAGMVISGVAARIPDRVALLVFLDAMVPADGESALDVMPVTQTMIDAAATSEHPWRIPPLPERPAPWGLFGVTDPDDLAWLRATLGDESVRCFLEPVHLGRRDAEAVPRAHIHCVNPSSPTRPGVPDGEPVRELVSGHDAMVIVPVELTDLLLELAGAEPGRQPRRSHTTRSTAPRTSSR